MGLRAVSQVVCVGAGAVWFSLVSCGGSGVAHLGGSYGPVDAAGGSRADANQMAVPPNDDATEEAPDGSDDTGSDDTASDDGGSDADAMQVDDGAANLPDVTNLAPTDNEVCHVVWPQEQGISLGSGGPDTGMQMAIDSAGNAYFAIDYQSIVDAQDASPSSIDLGVTSPGYAQGFAVAKVDAQCNLLWMREFGGAQGAASNSFLPPAGASAADSFAIGVDANSNVTVMGVFLGSVDLGAGTVEAPPVIVNDAGAGVARFETFLLRLDAAGNFVFSKVFKASDGESWLGLMGSGLAVAPDGVSTIVVTADGSSGVDFGDVLVAGTGTASEYLAQFDTSGNLLLARSLAPEVTFNPGEAAYDQLLADPTGALWASATIESDAGPIPSMIRLSATGDVLWSRPLAGALAVNANGEVGAYAQPVYTSPVGEDVVTAYSTDGTVTSSHVTAIDYLGELTEQVVLDPMGDTIIGGTFYGTETNFADGSFTQTRSPAGAGFQRFDPTGVLGSVTVWGGVNAEFGAVGAAPNGNVVLLGWTNQTSVSSPPATLFLVRFVP